MEEYMTRMISVKDHDLDEYAETTLWQYQGTSWCSNDVNNNEDLSDTVGVMKIIILAMTV